jgi:DNA-directed RNA polymerase subunit M/transcription elongation factor TFIIS
MRNPALFRQNIRSRIASVFRKKKEDGEDFVSYLSQNIEISVFNYAIQDTMSKKTIKKWENPIFVQIYIDKLRSVFSNLKNKDVVCKLLSGQFKPSEMAFMTHQQLNPENWRFLLELKQKRDESKFNVVIEPSTDVYVCRKCKSRKCTYSAQQTRSSDEPMTIYVSCLNCGKNWAC